MKFVIFLNLFIIFALQQSIFCGKIKTREDADADTRFTNDDRYCCKIDLPIITETYLQIIPYTYQASQNVVVGTQDCGLFGWSNCNVYGIRYSQATAYKQEVVVRYREDSCPSGFSTCCNGFALVGSSCLHIQTELVNGK